MKSKYQKLCEKADYMNEEFKYEGDKSRAIVICVGQKYRIAILRVLGNRETRRIGK